MSHRNGEFSPLGRWRARQCAVVVIEQRMLVLRASWGKAQEEFPAISATPASPRETCQGKR